MNEEQRIATEANKAVSPFRTLLFLLANAALCAFLMSVYPAEGIQVSEQLTLHFPTWEEVLAADSLENPALDNIDEFLESYTAPIDSTAIIDSLQQIEMLKHQALLKIQFDANSGFPLDDFFGQLNQLEASGGKEKVRVMHYGDSQIEGDRITGYLRNELQKRFGGYGPGLLPGLEVVPSAAIDQSNSSNWNRYTIFGKKDTSILHNRYGVLANFAGYTGKDDGTPDSAWIELRPSKMAFGRSRSYNQLRVWMGNNISPVQLDIYANDSLIRTEAVEPGGFKNRSYNLGSTPAELRLVFSGGESPEVYALSLESASGIHVDNIGMRGSSGTIFKRIDKALLRKQYELLGPDLLILQFGGNTVPYIKDEQKAKEYGSWFRSQIGFLKELLPETSFIVIGPSDMAMKEKDKYVTYPYLLAVRDALKSAAFETGCGYWDLYEVMGGKNSMEVWVNADPPLAASDYVHFSPKGARKVAELFHKALMDEYQSWKEENEE